MLNFDWHGTIKELKEPATVEGLWALLESVVPQVPSASRTIIIIIIFMLIIIVLNESISPPCALGYMQIQR